MGDFGDESEGPILPPDSGGEKQLAAEMSDYDRVHDAIQAVSAAPRGNHESILRRIQYLLNRRRHEDELAGEMEFHREMAAREGHDDNFGNTLRLREDRAMRGVGPGSNVCFRMCITRCGCCGNRRPSLWPPS